MCFCENFDCWDQHDCAEICSHCDFRSCDTCAWLDEDGICRYEEEMEEIK